MKLIYEYLRLKSNIFISPYIYFILNGFRFSLITLELQEKEYIYAGYIFQIVFFIFNRQLFTLIFNIRL